MSSRLDRLLLLLENGSTPVIRKSAAEQLGDVQKLYPHELENLLNKVHAYLMNNQWETRVAASQAVEAIIRNVEQWNPQGVPKGKDSAGDTNYLSLSAFDVSRVLEGGVQLIMCDAKSFDLPVNPDDPVNQDVNNKERLMEQKQQLNKRLGLEMCTALRISTPAVDGLITEEDFVVQETTESIHPQISSVNDFINESLSTNGIEEKQDGGSNNIMEASSGHHHLPLKRKAEDLEETSNSKKLKVERSQSSEAECGGSRASSSPSHDSEEKQPKEWPLMSFSNLLSNNLFNQIWEKRHGSALGLKVLVKLHGRGAGRTVDTPSQELARANQRWLEDLCVRLMCVLALDRLGDFLSDEVVAPVRESCAQVIGVACLHLEPMGIVSVVKALLQLVDYPKDMWEVKHGGLLGIKYVLAVRQDLTDRLLQEVLPSVCRCLADNSDDVRSVAASALIPVTNALATHSPTKALEIIDSLWTSLKELDDLTSSTNSVMTLLSLLISHPDIYNKCQNDSLSSLVPLIWPFLGHNISSVRRATLLTLNTLLQKSMTLSSDNTNQNSSCHWIRPILSSMLRLIFQRSVVEHEPYVLELVGQVWSSILSCADVPHLVAAVVPYFSSWMCLSMHPSNIPMDRNLFLILPGKGGEQSGGDNNFVKEDFIFLGGLSNIADSESERDSLVIRARLTSTKLLGQLCHRIADRKKLTDIKKEENPHTQPPQDPSFPSMPPGYLDAVANDLSTLFQVYLNSKSAIQRMVTAWVVKEWAESAIRDGMVCECPALLVARFKACLVDVLYYDEIASKFTRLQTECRAFMASLLTWGAKLEKPFNDIGALLTLEQISQLCSVVSQRSLCREGLSSQQESAYQKQKAELEANLSQVTALQDLHSNRVQCGIASVLVELRDYPDSLNPVIRPLMDCLKMEENPQSQEKTAEVLSQVVEHHKDRMPCPSTKIIKNLCSMYCIDATVSDESWDKFSDIQVLKSRQQMASSWRPRKYGPHKKNKEEVEGVDVSQNNSNQPTKDPNEVQKRGSVLALTSITRRPGSQLPTWVPDLWKVMFNSLETFATSALSNSIKEEPDSKATSLTRPNQTDNGVNIPSSSSTNNTPSETEAQDLLRSLTVLNLVAPQLDAGLQKELIDHFPHFLHCVEHPYTSVRHMAGRCLATVARMATEVTMEVAVSRRLVPWLCDSTNDRRKMGAVEALSLIIEELNVALVPYLVSLVLPMLGAMSDSNPGIRLVATNSFATLVRLMPLDKSIDMNSAEGRSDSPHVRPDAMATRVNKNYERDHMFLEQLLNPKLIEDFQIPVKLKVDLRRYQQDGVNWLSFLSRYKLHGILCDDMGLGKTLQSLCIIVSEHYRREQTLKNKQTDEKPPISLVVCPPTLTAHWLYEVEKVVPSDIIRPLHYVGSPSERTRLQKYVSGSNLVLASYDVVRNDIDFFSNIKWNYCILDEGHVIKNNKTKLSKAIKQLQCSHRLILSGTPIQNNVLELWSLFDFLMPGYLGTEKQFQLTFGRPILASRDARSSSKEQEAGTLALEALHRQVLPFMLRRLKEDVLKDLPPKIISDYYCDLSPLQVKLYEDYSKQHMDKMEVSTLVDDNNVDDDNDAKPTESGSSQMIEADGKKGKKKEKVSHIFQALQYLRKVCNHPMLAMNRHDDDSLREISHTSKLVALKQLLNDCGIGLTDASAVPSSSSSSTSDAMSGGCVPVVSQHRVILFCQMKIMLDIIEKDLFKRHMPTVTYLRLDGSIPAVNRLQIVHRFNNDPSIDVLLLTTQVGGLGLNLTGADTVVFYDHDWNPMKDLQAMDRAHRIGQKKVVTVYRLITRGTLEEKIMGLQKFKMNVAQSVVNQDNHSLAAMTSNQVLDLFCLNKNSNSKDHNASDHSSGRGGMKSFMEGFESLWDETQYRDEYDIDTFMKCLDG